MIYKETLDFLFSQLPMYQNVGKIAFKKDLTNTIRLMESLGHPENNFPSIHIAGTNGKGSVSHILAAMFQANGYKVGLYTSPHYKDFRERIKINGTLISKKYVIDFVEKWGSSWADIKPSFFEMTVALAFDYFSKKKVDIAIVETGLGGRLDSTNILSPMLSIITNIDYDHMDMLGETLPEIAFEKAGIIKENTPVVIGKYDFESGPVFQKVAKAKKSKLVFACKSKIGRLFIKAKVESDVVGPFQEENKRTAWVGFQIFKKSYGDWNLDDQNAKVAFRHIIDATYYIGRWQWLQKSPYKAKVLVDSAHNEQGLTLIAKALKKLEFEKMHLVLGFVKGKDHKKLLKLFPSKAIFYFSTPKIPRGMPVENIATIAKEMKLEYQTFETISAALLSAQKNADPSDLIFVGGSSFVTAEVI